MYEKVITKDILIPKTECVYRFIKLVSKQGWCFSHEVPILK